MAFDLSTAKPTSGGFDIASAQPEPQQLAAAQPEIGALLSQFEAAKNQGDFQTAGAIQQQINAMQSGAIGGALEAVGSIGSSIVAEPLSGLAGIGAAANPFAAPGAGARTVEAVRKALTLTPTSEEGKEELQNIGSLAEKGIDIANIPISGLAAIAELVTFQGLDQAVDTIKSIQGEGFAQTLAERTFEETGSPLAASLAAAVPEAVGAAIGARPATAAARSAATTAKSTASAISDVGSQATAAARSAVDIGADIFTRQSATKRKIAEKIAAGSTDVDIAGFQLSGATDLAGRPKVIRDATAIKAVSQGFDEGVVAAIKNASPLDHKAMRKMVNVMERGKKNARFAAFNRPSDVLGDSVMERVDIVTAANRAAGKQIDKVANSLKGRPIDVSGAVSDFADKLDELGVRLVEDSKGNTRPDFELSQLSPGDRGPIKEVIRQMNIQGRDGIDAFSAHKMKRIIDNNVTFGKVKTGLSGDAERALKAFRVGLDDTLDANFPEYNRINTAYSETVQAIDALQKVAGKSMDLTGPKASASAGQLMRGALSNNKSRMALLDSIEEIERTAKKYEGFKGELDPSLIEGPRVSKLTDDLLNQTLFVDELDAVFGPVARTSFQGQIKQAVGKAAEAQVSPLTAAARGAAGAIDKATGVSEAGKFKAIKQLLKAKTGS